MAEAEVQRLMGLARRWCEEERRHCIGRADVFDLAEASSALESALRELLPAPAAPEVPTRVTMKITGPCEAVWEAERRLLDQLRGWLIVRETTRGDIGIQEIEAVLTGQADRPFTAYVDYPAQEVPADARDAARLNWLERHLFEGKWTGTIGQAKSWSMAGPYRHTLQQMRGETLRSAIDAAMAAPTPQEPKHD